MTDLEPEFISIPVWCERVGCSLDSGYRAARRNDIPGLFRIGRLVRINWTAFVTATSEARRPDREPVPSVDPGSPLLGDRARQERVHRRAG
jgi:hypothetical protein